MKTYRETMDEMTRQGAADAALTRQLEACYRALGVSTKVEVHLPALTVGNGTLAPIERERKKLKIEALSAPCVAIIQREGRQPFLAGGETVDELKDLVRPPRSGPTGPLDVITILRSPFQG